MKYKDQSQRRKDQIKAAVKTRRQKIRSMLLDEFGRKCSKCGYDKCEAALEFHHLDPNEKELKIATNSRSYDLILEEARKCVLLCANCHREAHHLQDSY